MCQRNNNTIWHSLFALSVPIALLVAQTTNIHTSLILIVTFAVTSLLHKPTRKTSILIAILISGYLFWRLVYDYIEILFAHNIALENLAALLSRLGLIGYLFLFLGWYLWDKTNEHYFKTGCLSANIKIPFIWNGFDDNVLRVSGVFSFACIVAASIFAALNRLNFKMILMGITFSFVNAILEELLWRGFVLNRLSDCYGEKIALVVMSLTFGIYHYSLGFSIPICLLFSLGGIYFGGIAMKSKGLLAATVMHFCMNMLFVSIGIIFK